ncbi:hypothetical protein BX666DRAFT_1970969 [Dichotomocladium elegans]|nr:hypothetical protein BX666DRAFT_1970969 [Dichotomocladium elegans]
MRQTFGDSLLDETHELVMRSLVDKDLEFGSAEHGATKLIFDLKQKKTTHMEVIRKLMLMGAAEEEAQARILLGISKMVQKLPIQTVPHCPNYGEAEIWNSVFDPMLSTIISDPSRDVLLRWSNVVPEGDHEDEIVRLHPHAIMCQVDQLQWGHSLGHGEANLAEPTPNLDALAHNLVRLAVMNKEVLMKAKKKAAIAFQIHGWNVQVYVSTTVPGTGISVFAEVMTFTFPKSLHELDGFMTTTNMNLLVQLYHIFWDNCLEPRDQK